MGKRRGKIKEETKERRSADLLDGDVAALENGLIEVLDAAVRVLDGVHGHKGEAPGDAGAGLDHQEGLGHLEGARNKG